MTSDKSSLFQTVAFRYAMFYVSVISVLTFSIVIIAYTWTYFHKLQPKLAATQSEYQRIESLFKTGGLDSVKTGLASSATLPQPDSTAFYYCLAKQSDDTCISGNMAQWPGHISQWGTLYSVSLKRPSLGLYNVSARVLPLAEHRLLIGISIDRIFAEITMLAKALSLFMLGTIMLGFLGALVISYDSRRRVRIINDSIRTIMQGDLSERVPSQRSAGEFHMLAQNANKMLDRIQELVAGMRQFSNNIAHDLRTPLTRLRNNLETLATRVGEKNIDIVEQLSHEADGLMATFNALMRIAHIETGANRERFQVVNLKTILLDIIELYEPVAQEKEITIIPGNMRKSLLVGDKDMLFQLFANLLDNAIKYSPQNTHITISCIYRLGVVKVCIVDQGMGIPDAEKSKVFDRFYRVEVSRSQKPGNGLGLSLVAAVVELHEGMINLYDNNPGLKVDVKLPGINPSETKIRSRYNNE